VIAVSADFSKLLSSYKKSIVVCNEDGFCSEKMYSNYDNILNNLMTKNEEFVSKDNKNENIDNEQCDSENTFAFIANIIEQEECTSGINFSSNEVLLLLFTLLLLFIYYFNINQNYEQPQAISADDFLPLFTYVLVNNQKEVFIIIIIIIIIIIY
jgi:hypothetical protein